MRRTAALELSENAGRVCDVAALICNVVLARTQCIVEKSIYVDISC